MRKGMARGRGKGYKNIIGTDKRVHSMSAKGIKQPQRINPILNNPKQERFQVLLRGSDVSGYFIWDEEKSEIVSKHKSKETAEKKAKALKLKALKIKQFDKGWSMKTGVPIGDYPENYGYESKVVWMTPREFLKKAQSGYTGEYERNMPEDQHRRVTEYKKGIMRVKKGLKAGEGKVPIAWLEVARSGRLEHEGRNRAWASIDLGIKKIPVKILWKPDYKNKPNWLNKYDQNPFVDKDLLCREYVG